jgi:hypothetical protein
MSLRTLATIGAVLSMGWCGLLAAAHAGPYPNAECGFNADKSALEVIASNGSGNTYACTATCRYKVTGQRPIQTYNCNFALGANAAEKTECTLNGDGPGHFAETLPTRMMCEPR